MQELQDSYLEGFQDGIKTLHDNAYKKGLEIGSKLVQETIKKGLKLSLKELNFLEIVEISKSIDKSFYSKSLSW